MEALTAGNAAAIEYSPGMRASQCTPLIRSFCLALRHGPTANQARPNKPRRDNHYQPLSFDAPTFFNLNPAINAGPR
jgi:hypothetical protein